jgi:hypothetical protein
VVHVDRSGPPEVEIVDDEVRIGEDGNLGPKLVRTCVDTRSATCEAVRMTRTVQRPSGTRWALLTFLIATMLGHVCALPLHAHAATVPTHEHGDGPDGNDDAPHIGSCEALASSPTVQPLAVVTGMAERAASPLQAATWIAHDRVAAPPPRSTPLFLLHGSLLI